MTILDEYEPILHPIINSLLNVLITLSVKMTEIERSFSTLKRIKSLPRNKTGNERLARPVGLEVYVSPNDVLNSVAK